jgi:hypothetical protein
MWSQRWPPSPSPAYFRRQSNAVRPLPDRSPTRGRSPQRRITTCPNTPGSLSGSPWILSFQAMPTTTAVIDTAVGPIGSRCPPGGRRRAAPDGEVPLGYAPRPSATRRIPLAPGGPEHRAEGRRNAHRFVLFDGSHEARDPTKPSESNDLKCRRTQSGREDSNLRPLDPQSSALTRLRYAPSVPRAPWRDGSGRG